MREHLITSSLGLCVLASSLAAQEPVSRSYPLNPDGAVRIMSTSDLGSIRVVGWDRDSVVISGTLARGSRLKLLGEG